MVFKIGIMCPIVIVGFVKEYIIMKKEMKIVISAALAVWFFFMGFELGSYKEKKAVASTPVVTTTAPTTTEAPVTTTEAPTTLPEETTFPSANTSDASGVLTEPAATTSNSSETTTQAAAADPSAMSKEEILQAVTAAINGAKAETNMTAVKKETVTIQLTDLSISSAKDMVNKIIQSLAGEEIITYTFQNGQGTGVDQSGKATDDGASVTPMQVIPPTGREFALTADGVKDATVTKNGDSTVYTIKVVEENTTFASPIPTHHHAAYGYLDLTAIDISGAEITDANMHYPSTEITVTVNPDGKATQIHFYMPMTGDGAAKITIFSGNASFEGSDDETWDFTY